jgi:hypothetical protein
VLRAVKARPGNAGGALRAECRPALTPPARGGCKIWRSGRKNARGAGRTKEWDREEDEEAGADLRSYEIVRIPLIQLIPIFGRHNESCLGTQWVH